MTEVVPDWLVALFFAQAIGAVAYLIQTARLRGLLQQRHPQVWKSLGSPTLFFSNSPRNGMSVLDWLWRREYEGLGDAQTISLCKTVRLLLLACLCGFFALIALAVARGILINAKAT